MTSGTITSSSISGTDVVLKIGSGSIKVKNAVGKKITVVDSNGKSTDKIYGNVSRNFVESFWFDNENFDKSEVDEMMQDVNTSKNIITIQQPISEIKFETSRIESLIYSNSERQK